MYRNLPVHGTQLGHTVLVNGKVFFYCRPRKKRFVYLTICPYAIAMMTMGTTYWLIKVNRVMELKAKTQ